MSANPPLPTPVTPQSIVAMLLPIIQQELTLAITGALAAGGPVASAVVGSLAAMGPMIAASIVAAQNTPAAAAAMAQALADADAAVAAEKAAGA